MRLALPVFLALAVAFAVPAYADETSHTEIAAAAAAKGNADHVFGDKKAN